jgi:regulator of replication initiation timing
MAFGEEQLKRIQDKVQQLLRQHAALQKENMHLREQLSQTKLSETDQQKHVDELRQQVNILKLNAGEMNEEDKKDFEKRINGYLREIDRCIALLSN